jgi:hypothetical protein
MRALTGVDSGLMEKGVYRKGVRGEEEGGRGVSGILSSITANIIRTARSISCELQFLELLNLAFSYNYIYEIVLSAFCTLQIT